MNNKLLKHGNAKLHNTLVFSLPANKEVCGRECPGCYAIKFQKLYPNVLPYRQRSLVASKQPDFVQRITSDIASFRKPFSYLRIHESGEFYSQSYIDSWHTIASSHPSITFYTYTKRLADFDFSKLQALPNFVLINSLHFGGLNYGKTPPPGAFVCPATVKATKSTTQCGKTCTFCMQKQAQSDSVYFMQH